ncbi:DC-STAMP domain-containing protein 2-like [Lithobates pipiens]
MSGTYQSPREYVGGCCRTFCSYVNPCIAFRACCGACSQCCQCSEICDRDCCPDWCPKAADLKDPTQITALDHFDDDDKRAGGLKERSRWAKFLSSFFAFLMGLVITSIYGYLVIFYDSYNIYFGIYSTIAMGFFLCIGMAFSITIRVTVFLMIPHLFSGYARTIILLIILSMAMNGPAANLLENVQRVTNSSACGVQVVMNQTIEIVERVKEPLRNVLSYLKNIAGKVKTVAGKAKNFFQKVRERMKVIGKTLGHIWAFIHSIGDICNEELLNPHKKCTRAFADAKNNCLDIGAGVLCNIVDGFTWLCEVAKVATVICVIPSYVGEYIQKNIKAPVMVVLHDLKNKFDYNMTINYDLGGIVNSSKSVFTIARDIMEEVKQDLDPYREISHIFSYSVFLIFIITYYLAFSYLRNYTNDDNFDNVYITRKFVGIDARRLKQGLTTLLPLSTKESYHLIRPMAWTLTRKEKKGYSFEIMNIVRTLLIVSFIIAAAYGVYWAIAAISSVLNGDIVVKAPYFMKVNITGSGFINDILAQLADALDDIGQKDYTVISKQCIPVPSEPNYFGYIIIGGSFIFVFFASFFGVYIHRLKRNICASYYPEREQERICFLFNNLLTKRMNLERSLKKNVRLNTENVGRSNTLMTLAAEIPGFGFLTKLFGSTERYCLACAKKTTPATIKDFVECTTNSCIGLYCKDCFEILHNICVICMGPLAYKVDLDEELRDERLELWIEAMKSLKGKRTEKRKMKEALKKRLKYIVRSRGKETDVVQKYIGARQQDSDGESSGFSEHGSDSSESELTDYDYDYQYRSDTSDSEAESWPALEEYREPPDLIPRSSLFPGNRGKIGDPGDGTWASI